MEKLGFLLLPVMEMKMESLRVKSEVPAFSSLCFRRADASDSEMLQMADSWGFCTHDKTHQREGKCLRTPLPASAGRTRVAELGLPVTYTRHEGKKSEVFRKTLYIPPRLSVDYSSQRA